MVYSVHKEESDSAEDRRTCHVRINEREDVIIPTIGFGALNNSPGVNQSPRPNLNVSLGNRTVWYTQHSNFEAQNTQSIENQAHTVKPRRLPRSGGNTSHQNQDIDLNISLDFLNPETPIRHSPGTKMGY